MKERVNECKGGEKLRTRKRTISVPREENFVCRICKAKGNCSDEKNNKDPFFWNKDEGKITCVECGNQLETKEELKEDLLITEIQQYGFWIRFLSEHFIPCKECQEKLDKLLYEKTIWRTLNPDQPLITMEIRFAEVEYDWQKDDILKFDLNFVFRLDKSYKEGGYTETFVPCKRCVEEFKKLMINKEFHIGNDNKPLIEFWRSWEYLEEPDEETKKRIEDWEE